MIPVSSLHLRSFGLIPSLLLAVSLSSGCATVKPGTGDISFRLRWDGGADLDLHVVDPVGRHIGIDLFTGPTDQAAVAEAIAERMRLEEETQAIPKGILDIDCNADPERMCKRPIENIFWPHGTAPRGDYEVWVYHFQHIQGDGAVPFALEVRRGERVVERVEGTVSPQAQKSETVTVAY